VAISVTHTTVATGTDAGNGEIRKAQWNEAHTVTGVPDVFAQSGTAASVGAVTTEVVLATISFSGGEVGPNGWVEVTTHWTNNNNANNKQFNIRVGGTGGTLFMNVFNTTNIGEVRQTVIINNNSASSQKSSVPIGNATGYGGFASAGPTAAVNTAAAWDLVISGQKANSGDTLTLEGYQVIVSYGA
jgi:hypothetical protein